MLARVSARRSIVLCLAAMLLVGCGATMAPVLEVHDAKVVTPSGVTPTRPLVRDAIMRALISRTWQVMDERDQAIEAQVTAGGHSASVLIQYDEQSFSITRIASSPGLKYDGANIHRRYNRWIDRLRASIQQELGRATAAAGPSAPAAAAAEDPEHALPPAPPPPAAPAATGG